MPARLLVRTPGGQEHVFPLERELTVIGRGRQCDLVLESAFVSRRHASVEGGGESYTLADLGSTNGTSVNGSRLSGSHPLALGDEITIADITLTFLSESSDETTKTPLRITNRRSPIRCDSLAWEVWIGDKKLDARLSLQEFELLSLLAAHYGQVSTRDELGKAIWGENNYDYNMLHRLVHRLKRKIEKGEQRFIRSVPSVGYKIEVTSRSG